MPGAKLHLLVSDTTVRCNHGERVPLTSAQTIEARDLTDDLLLVQSGAVAYPKPPPAQIFHFKITDEEGTLRFPDTAQRPADPAAHGALRAARGDRHLQAHALTRARRMSAMRVLPWTAS